MEKAKRRKAQRKADSILAGYLERMEALESALDGCLDQLPDETAEVLDPVIDALAEVREFRAAEGLEE